ncbi:MAG: response regulator [Myxococcota bacterium]
MAHILVVDDNAVQRHLLRLLCSNAGYRVTQAVHGADALAAARRERPDLMVTDVLMPVMDGFTLCRRWMEDPSLRHIPVIIYTATYTDPGDALLAQTLGAAHYLSKPVDAERLLTVIGEELAARTPLASSPVFSPVSKPRTATHATAEPTQATRLEKMTMADALV